MGRASAHHKVAKPKGARRKPLRTGLDVLVEEIRGVDDPGYSLTEIAERMGRPKMTAWRRLQAPIAQGKCIKGRARRLSARGHMRWVPVYRMVES